MVIYLPTVLSYVHASLVNQFIIEFGGNSENITAFGKSTRASDILGQLRSSENATHPLPCNCAISLGLIEHDALDISAPSYYLPKLLLLVGTSSLAELRTTNV
jgi:hypothetical protein